VHIDRHSWAITLYPLLVAKCQIEKNAFKKPEIVKKN
jgi:hypothetical protein